MRDQQEAERHICPIEHKREPDRKRGSAPGSLLCAGCVTDSRQQLQRLSTFDSDATRAVYEQAIARKQGGPVSGSREKPLVINAWLSQCGLEAAAKLLSWVDNVIADQKLAVRPVRIPAGNLGRCARFLIRHHDWAVGQPWASDYAAEILEQGRRAFGLLHPKGNREFPVGPCLEVDAVDGSRCPGRLWACLTPDDPLYEAKSALICDACDFEIASDRWMSYGRRVIHTQDVA